jgi:hypothetical protein
MVTRLQSENISISRCGWNLIAYIPERPKAYEEGLVQERASKMITDIRDRRLKNPGNIQTMIIICLSFGHEHLNSYFCKVECQEWYFCNQLST